jgi:hypothetical protein
MEPEPLLLPLVTVVMVFLLSVTKRPVAAVLTQTVVEALEQPQQLRLLPLRVERRAAVFQPLTRNWQEQPEHQSALTRLFPVTTCCWRAELLARLEAQVLVETVIVPGLTCLSEAAVVEAEQEVIRRTAALAVTAVSTAPVEEAVAAELTRLATREPEETVPTESQL